MVTNGMAFMCKSLYHTCENNVFISRELIHEWSDHKTHHHHGQRWHRDAFQWMRMFSDVQFHRTILNKCYVVQCIRSYYYHIERRTLKLVGRRR